MDWFSNILRTEWFSGFISGVAATILGFLFTILWDIYKARRETFERDSNVIKAIDEELLSNKKALQQNLEKLEREFIFLGEDKVLVQPLFLLKTGFWDLAKLNLPKKLLRGNRLVRLRNITFLAEQVNEEIRSREGYRIHNGAMSNYIKRMRIYDESLVGILQDLSAEMRSFESEMNPKSNKRPLFRFLRRRVSKEYKDPEDDIGK